MSWKSVVIMLLFALLAGCSTKPNAVNNNEQLKDAPSRTVFVVNHGWHTGIIVPAREIQEAIPKLQQRFGDTPYIEFGWGDKDFYQASEITSGLTLKAIFLPTESVMHAAAVPQRVDQYYSENAVEKLCLNNSELTSLIGFIAESFYRMDSGEVIEIGDGIYGDSHFYRGAGTYFLTNTCNTWTSRGLKMAGINIIPGLTLTADGVMNSVKESKKALLHCSDSFAPGPSQ